MVDISKVELSVFPRCGRHLTNHEEEKEEYTKYMVDAQSNCMTKYNQIFIDGEQKGDLFIGNYPVHPDADVVAFSNKASVELNTGLFTVVFVTDCGQSNTFRIDASSSSYNKFMVKIPTINGSKPSKLWFSTGDNNSGFNTYNLRLYHGEKKILPREEFYWDFRVGRDDESFIMELYQWLPSYSARRRARPCCLALRSAFKPLL